VIKIKHLMDEVEDDDGVRMWVEPINLTRDLQEWCEVDVVLAPLAPCQSLIHALAGDAETFDSLMIRFHDELRRSPNADTLRSLAIGSLTETFTLLHASDDNAQNCAVALFEFLVELASHRSADDET
jgi:uncharacterized protein YeaO (DUF488 family)